MRTCISPTGAFRYGIHKPSYTVRNLRQETRIEELGRDQSGNPVLNELNFPAAEVAVPEADWIYEISNPFPFRGATFIGKAWADRNGSDIERIRLPSGSMLSFTKILASRNISPDLIDALPRPLLLSLATSSTDPDDLVSVAHCCCTFTSSGQDEEVALRYISDACGHSRPDITDHELFEALANNPALPAPYKIAMVIRPGAQGGSEIVGDYHNNTHVYEYLRKNSYIAGGHYAANMSDDAIRYDIDSLHLSDMTGLRHLYYQRTYVRMADLLGIALPSLPLSPEDLEAIRFSILQNPGFYTAACDATLWGWNFGFDFASTGYRLHASHQQIHQQYALIPAEISTCHNGREESLNGFQPFSAGDMVSEVVEHYRRLYKSSFFTDYLRAIENNTRMDGRTDREQSLVVWQDDRVILFVPKAQTSQWELQIMTRPDNLQKWPGTIIETDLATRKSLDKALLKGQQALAGRGARMVTTIELSKRFSSAETAQPLIYSLIPKIPQSPGAFSENQLRFINGHYPEDFATACRQSLQEKSE